jgi:alpha-D-ribose 1-methylphosphonate 5-triphosphate synthase subunit PhnH
MEGNAVEKHFELPAKPGVNSMMALVKLGPLSCATTILVSWKAVKTTVMENGLPFALNAAHSGAINHAHSFHFNSSVVDAFKEVRFAVTIVVVGWIAVTSIRAFQDRFRPSREP